MTVENVFSSHMKDISYIYEIIYTINPICSSILYSLVEANGQGYTTSLVYHMKDGFCTI